jgi:hypothetical protein
MLDAYLFDEDHGKKIEAWADALDDLDQSPFFRPRSERPSCRAARSTSATRLWIAFVARRRHAHPPAEAHQVDDEARTGVGLARPRRPPDHEITCSASGTTSRIARRSASSVLRFGSSIRRKYWSTSSADRLRSLRRGCPGRNAAAVAAPFSRATTTKWSLYGARGVRKLGHAPGSCRFAAGSHLCTRGQNSIDIAGETASGASVVVPVLPEEPAHTAQDREWNRD